MSDKFDPIASSQLDPVSTQVSETEADQDEWMTSYLDVVTILLVFFVLLIDLNNFNTFMESDVKEAEVSNQNIANKMNIANENVYGDTTYKKNTIYEQQDDMWDVQQANRSDSQLDNNMANELNAKDDSFIEGTHNLVTGSDEELKYLIERFLTATDFDTKKHMGQDNLGVYLIFDNSFMAKKDGTFQLTDLGNLFIENISNVISEVEHNVVILTKYRTNDEITIEKNLELAELSAQTSMAFINTGKGLFSPNKVRSAFYIRQSPENAPDEGYATQVRFINQASLFDKHFKEDGPLHTTEYLSPVIDLPMVETPKEGV